MRGCLTLLSIISWMSLVLTALFKGIVSAQTAVWVLVAGIFLLATSGRKIMGYLMPIGGLLILLFSLAHGAASVFLGSIQYLGVLAVMCLGFYLLFGGLRQPP